MDVLVRVRDLVRQKRRIAKCACLAGLLAASGARDGAVFAVPVDAPLNVRRLTPHDGLPPAVVYCILQDSRGFLWFGTADGVARYDGHEFRTFRSDPDDGDSLGNPAVLAIQEDARGNLWMATEGGLDLWHRETERFSHYRHDPGDSATLSDDVTRSLLLDAEDVLWVGTAKGGLDRVDTRTARSEHVRLHPGGSLDATQPGVRCLLRDREGFVWIGTDAGLFRLEPRTRQIRRYRHDPRDPRSLCDGAVLALVEDDSGRIWVGTEAGLCALAADRRFFERHEVTGQAARSRRAITALVVDRDRRLWVGTDGYGVCGYNPSTRTSDCHRHSGYLGSTPVSDTVRSIYEDRRGDLWVGHFPAGVSHVDRMATAFKVFANRPGETDTLSDNHVLSFLEDPSGDLWVGTDNGGLNRWTPRTGHWTHYQHSTASPSGLGGKAAACLLRDHMGRLWVGTWNAGLYRLEPDSGTFRRYVPIPGNAKALSNAHAWQLAEDHERRLWIATVGGGVERYDPESDSFVHHRHDPANPRSLNDDIATALLVTRDGALWVGTRRGLARWNPATRDWDRFEGVSDRAGTLSGHWIFDLLEDRQGMIWVSTEGGGLNRVNPRNGECDVFRTAEGFPSDALRGLLQDDAGALWVGSNRGLVRFSPDTGLVRVFDESNGLPDVLFAPHARLRLRSGEFLFGTAQGFIRFDPRDVTEDRTPPAVVFTGFEIFNQRVRPGGAGAPLERSITETRRLVLAARFPVIGFQFSALTFRSSDRVQYRFKLEGFDADWRTPGPERRATFTNLDPGNYRLRVKAANADGAWNEEGVALDLVIVPPWWLTWWFRTAMLVAFVGGFIGIGWVISLHQLNRQLNERVRQRTAQLEAANAELEAFAYSVSHDLRAPVRHVDAFVQRLSAKVAGALDDQGRHYLHSIGEAARRMGELIDDLLAFSRMAAAEMTRVSVDLTELVDDVVQELAAHCGARAVDWQIGQLPVVVGDRAMLRLVLVNLISNALKFTGPRAHAIVEIGSRSLPDGSTVVYVRDNGVGFDSRYANKLFRVFERLHAVDAFEGTGIGLANVRRVVERHGGRAWAEGEVDVGATFSFSLPGAPLHDVTNATPTVRPQ